jgi:hypothetical protein
MIRSHGWGVRSPFQGPPITFVSWVPRKARRMNAVGNLANTDAVAQNVIETTARERNAARKQLCNALAAPGRNPLRSKNSRIGRRQLELRFLLTFANKTTLLRRISAYKTDGIAQEINYLRFSTGLQNLHGSNPTRASSFQNQWITTFVSFRPSPTWEHLGTTGKRSSSRLSIARGVHLESHAYTSSAWFRQKCALMLLRNLGGAPMSCRTEACM